MSLDKERVNLEEWKEIRKTLRYFGNKRFAQLTVYIAANALIFKPFFDSQPPRSCGLPALAIALGILFAAMERRSNVYVDAFVKRGNEIEEKELRTLWMMRRRPDYKKKDAGGDRQGQTSPPKPDVAGAAAEKTPDVAGASPENNQGDTKSPKKPKWSLSGAKATYFTYAAIILFWVCQLLPINKWLADLPYLGQRPAAVQEEKPRIPKDETDAGGEPKGAARPGTGGTEPAKMDESKQKSGAAP